MAWAMRWVAAKPEQCSGTMTSGLISTNASTTGWITGSRGPAVEVDTTHYGVHLVHACLALDVPDDVDDAGMAAAGDNHQPLVPEVDG